MSDALYDEAGSQFNEKELVDLTGAVVAINASNRLAVTFRTPVGSYKLWVGPNNQDREETL